MRRNAMQINMVRTRLHKFLNPASMPDQVGRNFHARGKLGGCNEAGNPIEIGGPPQVPVDLAACCDRCPLIESSDKGFFLSRPPAKGVLDIDGLATTSDLLESGNDTACGANVAAGRGE